MHSLKNMVVTLHLVNTVFYTERFAENNFLNVGFRFLNVEYKFLNAGFRFPNVENSALKRTFSAENVRQKIVNM